MRRIAWVLGDIDAGVGEPVGHVAAHRVRAMYPVGSDARPLLQGR